jgi:AbrB family looped-hinge helix DNA binding protein
MRSVATTKMSSKGQVVIPEEVRRQLGLGSGTQFIVLGEGDTVILKMVRVPPRKDFDHLLRKARAQAKAAGLKRSDIAATVSEVRRRR